MAPVGVLSPIMFSTTDYYYYVVGAENHWLN